LPGQSYLLSFWLSVTSDLTGQATPNVLRAQWNGKNLFAVANLPESGWTNLQFLVTASSTNTALQFLFQDDPAFLGLDDVNVTPIPALRILASRAANASLQLTWATLPGLSYQIQYKSDLNQSGWTNLGSPILATGASANVNDNLGAATSRFYRLSAQLVNQ
jgi:hypothetical protein